MGCFSYICKGCGTSIRSADGQSEKCVMIHVRHGKELGRTMGHYNGYGGVEEDGDKPDRFRGEIGKNSHKEIIHSEMELEDSYDNLCDYRLYKGKKYLFTDFLNKRFVEDMVKADFKVKNIEGHIYLDEFIKKDKELKKTFDTLKSIVSYKDNLDRESYLALLEQININIQYSIGNLCYKEKVWYYEEFMKLPKLHRKNYSGIVAYHCECYKKAMREGTFDLVPSESDPNQGFDIPRKKFM